MGDTKSSNNCPLTVLEGLIENTQTPGALAATFDDLHAELILSVRLEFIDVRVQVGRVDAPGPPG